MKFFIKRPIISLLIIFGFWVNSQPLPQENIIKKTNNNSNTTQLLVQNQNSEEEYKALMGSGENEVTLVAFRLLNFHVNVKNERLDADFRVVETNYEDPNQNFDLKMRIPEERVLLKLYQLPGFGVKVPPKIDLEYAQKLPTAKRLEYIETAPLKMRMDIVSDALINFKKHLKDKETKIFVGEFGNKYENEGNKPYKGFFVHNQKSGNMMFFKKDLDNGGYSLHSYMSLTSDKSKYLAKYHSLF